MENPRFTPSAEELHAAEKLLKTRSFPELERLSEAYIEKITGKKWNDETVLEKIRAAVVSQKDAYWKEGEKRNVSYSGAYSVMSYIAYQMPGYVFEISEFLVSLISRGLMRKHIRVLDLGAGPGTASAAVIRICSLFPEMSAEICAAERMDTHREAYSYLIPSLLKTSKNCTAEKPLSMDITQKLPDGTFDVIICANVLNELAGDDEAKTEFLISVAKHLTPDGNLLVFEPADLENAAKLRDITRAAKERGLTLYAPCNDLRGVPCRVHPCWSFESYDDIKPTALMEALGSDTEKYRYVNTDVKFSYAVLRTDGHRRCGYKIPADAKRARLSQIKQHEGKRIHVTVSVMSGDIGDAKTYLYLVCDGSGTVPCYLALPAFHRTPEHEALLTAPYAGVVAVDSVLVRWNEKQKAYNLLMGKNSTCRLIAGTPVKKFCPDKAKAVMRAGKHPAKTGRPKGISGIPKKADGPKKVSGTGKRPGAGKNVRKTKTEYEGKSAGSTNKEGKSWKRKERRVKS
ncbi:MAG: class I SAM-dependent methyltransferase [Methanocorpusculum sp.]|nr:class I SAM-dependent methyltransferase [Methanocorpusculum sp.]